MPQIRSTPVTSRSRETKSTSTSLKPPASICALKSVRSERLKTGGGAGGGGICGNAACMASKKSPKASNLSGLAQPLTIARPPGRSTRCNSAKPLARSGKSIRAKLQAARLKLSSSSASACPSITSQSTCSAPVPRAAVRATGDIRRKISRQQRLDAFGECLSQCTGSGSDLERFGARIYIEAIDKLIGEGLHHEWRHAFRIATARSAPSLGGVRRRRRGHDRDSTRPDPGWRSATARRRAPTSISPEKPPDRMIGRQPG